ncbi:MAG: FecR family protein [Flavitalea sp.]
MAQLNKRYYELAEKWLNGTITEEEKKEFSEWYNNDEDTILNIPEKFASSEEKLRTRILSAISKKQRSSARISILKKPAAFATALCVLIFVSFSLFYFSREKPDDRIVNTTVIPPLKDDTILPGGNKAILVLGDGTELVLDSASNGTIAEDVHAKVIKLDDGQLAYTSSDQSNKPVTYNTLSTPRGGQYAITITDGTKVWLNSASSLRFPSVFEHSSRIVELSGEGYFEVAPSKEKPFIVRVNNIEVKVLGTHFNVMAYNDELSINTTLIEGSVLVSQQVETATLRPGQQAQVSHNGKIGIIKNADVEQAVAWKNGVFNFNGSDIESTMRQISRWYDIEVTIENKITEHFYGSIPRNSTIEKVLQMLEYTGVVHFTREGRKVFVRH